MTKQDLIKTLSKYSNGGNACLLFTHLSLKQNIEIRITQEELALELNKTRPAIYGCLILLKKIGVIDFGYNNIIMKEIL